MEVGEVKYIGKETNMLDMVANDIVAPGDETLAFYEPDEWENKILPRLKGIPVYKIVKETGINAGNIAQYLSGRHRPEGDNLKKIKEALPRLDKYDEWAGDLLPRLKKMPTREIARLAGIVLGYVSDLKNGKRKPGVQNDR